MKKIPVIKPQLAHAKTSSSRGASLLSPKDKAQDEFAKSKSTAAIAAALESNSNSYEATTRQRKKSVDQQNEDTDEVESLVDQVEKFHPELLLLHPNSQHEQHHHWQVRYPILSAAHPVPRRHVERDHQVRRVSAFLDVGLLLRWESALCSMEPYARIPEQSVEDICKLYIAATKHQLRSKQWSALTQVLEAREPANERHPSASPPRMRVTRDTSDPITASASASARGGYNTSPTSTTCSASTGSSVHTTDITPMNSIVSFKVYDVHRKERVVQPLLELPKPLRDWNFSVKKTQIARVVRKMCEDGIMGSLAQIQQHQQHHLQDGDDSSKLAVVYDLHAIDMALQALLTSFPSHFEHRFAMKSCPLAFFVKRAVENDVGLECASIIEVQHALRLGCAPSKIVFDSPCKTRRDIAFAINAGVEVNADNFDELQITREHPEELFQSNFPECTPRFADHLPRIGLRVNPLLGAGSNEVLSVSTVHSKFGVPLTAANRAKIIEFFRENPWMTGLLVLFHITSQLQSNAPLAKQNIAGSLCFGGDVIGRHVVLPTIARGDFVAIHDSGSNTISLFSCHCSRLVTAVYGYQSNGDDISIDLLKPAETSEDVMRFWGR